MKMTKKKNNRINNKVKMVIIIIKQLNYKTKNKIFF